LLNRYDPVLGWSGIPGAKGWDYTGNNPIYVEYNSLGFRDIEHDMRSTKPAIVFLGASYVWGFDMQTDEMFVNLLRGKLSEYEVFNLSHICYGLDQDLLALENWQNNYNRQIELVILVFTSEDVGRNNSTIECEKGKPKFEIVNGELVLTGVPVPKTAEFESKKEVPVAETIEQQNNIKTWKASLREFMFNSYFLHALYNRYSLYSNTGKFVQIEQGEVITRYQPNLEDLNIISKILEKIDKDAKARGARFMVFFVPSSLEINNDLNYHPYQHEISKLCEKPGIWCFDLAPYFKKAWWKTYTRDGLHWNEYGHKLAAEAIYSEIKNEEH
jgi:lysophospholipase L1-like esterase